MAKILIIEDEAGPMRFLNKVITRMGHDAICTDNGQAGLDQASSVNPDLILSDLKMPGRLDGIELLRALRKACPNTGIVVISGFPSDKVLQECTRLGIAEFLTKPFEVGFVHGVVEKLLNQPAQEHLTFE